MFVFGKFDRKFVFLKHPFRDLPFCHITDEKVIVMKQFLFYGSCQCVMYEARNIYYHLSYSLLVVFNL